MLELKECKMNHVQLCAKINELRKMEGNRKTIDKSDLLKKITKEVKTLQTLGFNTEEYFKSNEYKDKSGKMNRTYEISIKGLEWLRDNNIHDVRAYSHAIKELNPNYEIEHINIASTHIRKELLIHKILLAWFDENQIKTQYTVLNYRLDYFIPSCKLIIEYDEESGHKDKEKDNKRMNEILNYIFDKWKHAESKEDYKFYDEDDWAERENDNLKPNEIFTVIRIKEFEEEKGLNELFEFLTGDKKWASKLINLNR